MRLLFGRTTAKNIIQLRFLFMSSLYLNFLMILYCSNYSVKVQIWLLYATSQTRCNISSSYVSFALSWDRDAVADMSQLYYRQADNSSYRDRIPLRVVRAEAELSALERAYLGAVEKGDYASVKQALEEAEIYFRININCIDPLGRTALLIAIDNENLEIIELLLSYNVYVGDALLHAISKEVVGAVELLLNHKKPRGEKQVL